VFLSRLQSCLPPSQILCVSLYWLNFLSAGVYDVVKKILSFFLSVSLEQVSCAQQPRNIY
jgi:hypothetical protein